MAISRVCFGVTMVMCLFFVVFVGSPVKAQPTFAATTPAPAPTSDGTSIDQGIAYVLMLAALVLTYLIHPLDASSYNFF